ncbi:SDR family oxidoreductase [Sulfitobacter sp. CW3]|uniref:SDR family oxidoreductase n=1 Tax=Sulfitobacter sp. CW3 TaxID=2861965 RepID=UPI002150F76B|nr:SDR family oxidoreductase [Sulfitobacter sp. CW3]
MPDFRKNVQGYTQSMTANTHFSDKDVNMTDPTIRTALVTGASRGIGAAIAARLAREGFNVVVNYAGSEAAAVDIVSKIQADGGRAISARADVSDATDVKRLFDCAETEFGGIDVLVNNAGIMKLAKIEDSDDDLFDTQVAVNLKGTFNTLREASARLSDGGRIINLSTSVVGLKLETYAVYAGLKAAVETMTGIMAKEMRGRNITVNAVAPGPTATALFLDGKPEELVQKMSKIPPLERLATPEDIANVVAFLAGSDGGWINGQILRANGGLI